MEQHVQIEDVRAQKKNEKCRRAQAPTALEHPASTPLSDGDQTSTHVHVNSTSNRRCVIHRL
jgi:hypothetical protein